MVQHIQYYDTDIRWVATFAVYSLISTLIMFGYLWFAGGNFVSMHRFFSYLPKPDKILMFLVVMTLICSMMAGFVASVDLTSYLLQGKNDLNCREYYILYLGLWIATRWAQYVCECLACIVFCVLSFFVHFSFLVILLLLLRHTMISIMV